MSYLFSLKQTLLFLFSTFVLIQDLNTQLDKSLFWHPCLQSIKIIIKPSLITLQNLFELLFKINVRIFCLAFKALQELSLMPVFPNSFPATPPQPVALCFCNYPATCSLSYNSTLFSFPFSYCLCVTVSLGGRVSCQGIPPRTFVHHKYVSSPSEVLIPLLVTDNLSLWQLAVTSQDKDFR
jgi:hypothetical protein